MPAPFGNDMHKIERYRRFWQRAPVTRPLVGFSIKSWFPLQEYAASAAWQDHDVPHPRHGATPKPSWTTRSATCARASRSTTTSCAAPRRRRPCPGSTACSGSRLRILPGSILGEPRASAWDEMPSSAWTRTNPWLQKYLAFLDALVAARRPLPRHARHAHRPLRPAPPCAATATASLTCWRSRQQAEAACGIAARSFAHHRRRLGAPAALSRRLLRRAIPALGARPHRAPARGRLRPLLARAVPGYLQPVDRAVAQRFPSAFIHLHPPRCSCSTSSWRSRKSALLPGQL